MKVADVYIEYSSLAIDRSFTYTYDSEDVRVGTRVFVRFSNREIMGFVVKTYEMKKEDVDALTYEIQPILRCVDEEPLLNDESFQIAHFMAESCVAPLISCFQAMLPSKLKPKGQQKRIKEEVVVVYQKDVVFKGKKQQEAMEVIKEKKEMSRKEFASMFSCIPKLVSEGAVLLETREAQATLTPTHKEDKRVVLNDAQKEAISKIQKLKGEHVHLLHGVTGSGKTEVFLHLAKDVLEKGKQVLILVPEISLTPQMVNRVKARFGEAVAIYHSALNNQEKYEQFQLVKNKKVSIVVGTRSAVFMPFDDLGLIIMDEEHDQSYKQESTPRYHCRDIALFRAKYHHCPLVLASATPSLETYARAYKGVYQLVELPKRIYDNMPSVHIVDMKDEMKQGGDYILSDILKEQIYHRLEANQQVIILLNRRGYSPILRCMECGHVETCPHCDLALNYHKTSNTLVCHCCDFHKEVNRTCSECGSSNIKYIGLGTQRLQEHLKDLFPSARVLRMDADTTSKKGAHEKLLDSFERHEYDILIGTQMIAKGLDYENVTLVGIVNGDAMLARSDYRSVELTFDLLTQASGRSGRGKLEGEVYIQVYEPNHYAITCAAQSDYENFFKQEMQFRHVGKYPPFYYIASVVLKSVKEDVVEKEADNLRKEITKADLRVLGPAGLLKRNDEYRSRIIVKSQKLDVLQQQIRLLSEYHRSKKHKSILEIDMNPVHIE